MKNLHQEALRVASQVAGRLRSHAPLVQGLLALPGTTNGSLSYSYLLKYKSGEQWVIVRWEHPRKVWLDRIEELAFEMALDDFPGHEFSLRGAPILARVGASRKQVVGHSHVEAEAFHARFEQYLLSAREAANLEVHASFRVMQTERGREVDIVCPLELFTPEDGQWLSRKVRKFMRAPGLFTAHYANYVYTRADFGRERSRMGL